MTISIPESGVTFGPFAIDDCFYIEKSPALAKLGAHIKIAEFVVRLNSTDGEDILALVEAKSSIPKETDAYFAEIREKLVNTFTLLMLASIDRQQEMLLELPTGVRGLPLNSCNIRLFLVIPIVPDKYLSQFTDKFRQALRVERKTWALRDNDVWVLNEAKAQRWGLIN